MTIEQIMELYKKHDYMTLEEEGFLTPGLISYAFRMGVLSRKEVEYFDGWFY